MSSIFNNRITIIKIIFMLSIACLAVLYNVKLFTAKENGGAKSINISDVYYKWNDRKRTLTEVTQMTKTSKQRHLEIRKISIDHPEIKKNVEDKSVQFQFNADSENLMADRSENIDGIKVERDELLYVRFIETVQNDESNDSEEPIIYRIEFWSSPINFVGYKKQKNKIILYGIEDIDEVNFKFAHNKLCFHYGQDYFEIEETNDFKQFCPISDKDIIATLIEDEP